MLATGVGRMCDVGKGAASSHELLTSLRSLRGLLAGHPRRRCDCRPMDGATPPIKSSEAAGKLTLADDWWWPHHDPRAHCPPDVANDICWRQNRSEPPRRRSSAPSRRAEAHPHIRVPGRFAWLTRSSAYPAKMAQIGVGANRCTTCEHQARAEAVKLNNA